MNDREPAVPPTVEIAPMRRRDVRAVLRIERRVYPSPWSMALFVQELAYGDARIYRTARVGGRLVGYAGAMLAAGDAHVTTIAVDPAWHRRKIGSRLLLTLARAARAAGAEALTLEVRAANEAAQAMYRRFGFRPAGVRRNYYSSTGEDAIVMWAHDIDSAEYARRLDDIAAEIPGDTVWRAA